MLCAVQVHGKYRRYLTKKVGEQRKKNSIECLSIRWLKYVMGRHKILYGKYTEYQQQCSTKSLKILFFSLFF